jgi:hypothetical protein
MLASSPLRARVKSSLGRASTERSGRLLVAVLAGGWLAIVLGVAVAGSRVEVAASLGATCLVSVLFLTAGWDVVVRAIKGAQPIAFRSQARAGRVLRYVPAITVLAAGFAAGHYFWK